jgi:RecB family exonuclease
LSSKWILSATELETFKLCQRKWAYTYLDGIKPAPSKAAELGSSVHKFLEDYLIGNSINYQTHEARIARPGLHYLPERLNATLVEQPFFFINNSHIFHGYIDFYEHIGCQTWLIGDHKTSSKLSNALTSEELKRNIQATIYAQWAFQELGADTVKLKWVYYLTKGTPQAKCVEAEIKREEQPSLFEPQLEIASAIKGIVKNKPSSLDLPKNMGACFTYGRCPFYGPCKANQKPAAATLLKKPIEVRSVSVISRGYSQEDSMKGEKQESFHLYVDCLPTKSQGDYERTIELSELLKPVLTKIQTEKELSHYRLAGYGQHVGLMATYLSDYLKNSGLDKRVAVLSNTKTPEGCDTLQTLSAAAARIVRGF